MKPVNFQDLGSLHGYTHYVLVVPYVFLTILFSQRFFALYSLLFFFRLTQFPPLRTRKQNTEYLHFTWHWLSSTSFVCFSLASIPSPTCISDEDYILCDSIYITYWKRWNCRDRNQIYGFQGLDVREGDWVHINVLLGAMEIFCILIVWCLHDCRGLLKFAELHVLNKSECLCI